MLQGRNAMERIRHIKYAGRQYLAVSSNVIYGEGEGDGNADGNNNLYSLPSPENIGDGAENGSTDPNYVIIKEIEQPPPQGTIPDSN